MNDSFEFLKRWYQVLAEADQKEVKIKRQKTSVSLCLQDAKDLQANAQSLLGQSLKQLEQSVKSYQQSWSLTRWFWRQLSDIAAREEIWSYYENYQKWAVTIEDYGYQQADFSLPADGLPPAKDTSLSSPLAPLGVHVQSVTPSIEAQTAVKQEVDRSPFYPWAQKYYKAELNSITKLCSSKTSEKQLQTQLQQRKVERKQDFEREQKKWLRPVPQANHEEFKQKTRVFFDTAEKNFQQKVESVILKQPLSRITRIINICLSWYPGRKTEQALVKVPSKEKAKERSESRSINEAIDIEQEVKRFESIPASQPEEAIKMLKELKSAVISDLNRLTEEGLRLAKGQGSANEVREVIQTYQSSLEKKCRIFARVCHSDKLQRFQQQVIVEGVDTNQSNPPSIPSSNVIQEANDIFNDLQEARKKKLEELEPYKENPEFLFMSAVEISFVRLKNELASLVESTMQIKRELYELKEDNQRLKEYGQQGIQRLKEDAQRGIQELREDNQRLKEDVQQGIQRLEKKIEANKHEFHVKLTECSSLMNQMMEQAKQIEQLKNQQTGNVSTEEDVIARNDDNNNNAENIVSKETNQIGGPGFFDNTLRIQAITLQSKLNSQEAIQSSLEQSLDSGLFEGPK